MEIKGTYRCDTTQHPNTLNSWDINAEKLGTNYYEVDWHPGARPEHRKWQGKVYSKEELVSVCGLGTATGLQGANCYHDYYPFVKGASERQWSDEWLRKQNAIENKTKRWQGKELDAYGITQQQRRMETAMRAQRSRIMALKTARADPDNILTMRVKYKAQLYEYTRFCRKMGVEQQRRDYKCFGYAECCCAYGCG